MSIYNENLPLDSDFAYQQYAQPPLIAPVPVVEGGLAPVVTINGNGGAGASGPNVTISGGSTGYDFNASGSTISLVVSNPATIRSSINAAQSGVNGDITQFTALTGSGGWAIWTGTPDKTSHATYSGTASVGYTQAELQGVMDKLKQITEAFKALQDTLLAGGEIKP